MLKIVTQTLEPEARDQLVYEGIFRDMDSLAMTMLANIQPHSPQLYSPTSPQSPQHFNGSPALASPETSSPSVLSAAPAAEYGISIVLRCLQTEQNTGKKAEMSSMVRHVLDRFFPHGSLATRGQFFKRLAEEVHHRHHHHHNIQQHNNSDNQ
jgi:hypothetical protein